MPGAALVENRPDGIHMRMHQMQNRRIHELHMGEKTVEGIGHFGGERETDHTGGAFDPERQHAHFLQMHLHIR